MATLTGSTIASSYDQLLCLPSGGGNTTTLVALTDGNAANTFCLQLATTKAMIEGNGSTLYFFDEGGESISADNAGILSIAGGAEIDITTPTVDINASTAVTVDGPSVAISSTSASEPVLHITNTHAGATAGEIRFNKDSASGADNDVMGTISWYGTDDDDNTHERLAYMDAIITDSAEGSEAASLRFYVAENDATLTKGLEIAGQPDDNAEVDVTIGAGASSTTTIAGDLSMTAGDIKMNGSAGQGIDFSGSQAAADAGSMTSEVLDSYEEGEYSPTLTCSNSGSFGLDGSYDTLRYTKCGRIVFIQGQISVTSESAPDGQLHLSLPFTVGQGTDISGRGVGTLLIEGHGGNYEDKEFITIFFVDATAYVKMKQLGRDGTMYTLDKDDVDTNFWIYVGFSYTT